MKPTLFRLPTIPAGWHRLRVGALLRAPDRYFNFSDRRWEYWPHPKTAVTTSGNDFTSPWFIRRNSGRHRNVQLVRGQVWTSVRWRGNQAA